jgi:hypothetical protein
MVPQRAVLSHAAIAARAYAAHVPWSRRDGTVCSAPRMEDTQDGGGDSVFDGPVAFFIPRLQKFSTLLASSFSLCVSSTRTSACRTYIFLFFTLAGIPSLNQSIGVSIRKRAVKLSYRLSIENCAKHQS